MKKLTSLLMGSFLLLGAVACNDVAKTSTGAPDAPNQTAEAPKPEQAKEIQKDAQSELRRRQLNEDIRAREQRNNITGGDAIRADGDLESEVRSKLEANLPASQLTVAAKDGVVTVAGTVPTQPQYERIDPLAKEIKGVRQVVVNVAVVPAKEGQEAQSQTEDNNAQPVINNNNSEQPETEPNTQQ
ncbi:Transport-associated protein [Planktothrix tepida]|uniref:Transport-associated protein n=2 Tax=Planktothrix TaxID=54304 RepID=A0A1J1LKZ9_9CYAN|nr:BON domain-containing protein [Planktothrix tepida]CAD5939803.1 Transport-associated protein [Planktothrix tepida]CAD5971767.1 Transport-associated protein [Planktothrix pseudagardhii]CUR33192.1 Transport-associated protein [Planktothrix tepida PCC 9214]